MHSLIHTYSRTRTQKIQSCNTFICVHRHTHTSRNSLICSFRPPISLYFTLPGSSRDILCTSGSTSRGSVRIMVRVVKSRDTRVPGFNAARSTYSTYVKVDVITQWYQCKIIIMHTIIIVSSKSTSSKTTLGLHCCFKQLNNNNKCKISLQ